MSAAAASHGNAPLALGLGNRRSTCVASPRRRVEDRRGPDLGKSPRQGVPVEAHSGPGVALYLEWAFSDAASII